MKACIWLKKKEKKKDWGLILWLKLGHKSKNASQAFSHPKTEDKESTHRRLMGGRDLGWDRFNEAWSLSSLTEEVWLQFQLVQFSEAWKTKEIDIYYIKGDKNDTKACFKYSRSRAVCRLAYSKSKNISHRYLSLTGEDLIYEWWRDGQTQWSKHKDIGAIHHKVRLTRL